MNRLYGAGIAVEGEFISHDFYDKLLKSCGDSLEFISNFSIRMTINGRCPLEHRRGLAGFILDKRPDLSMAIQDVLKSVEADEFIAHIGTCNEQELDALIESDFVGNYAMRCNKEADERDMMVPLKSLPVSCM